MASFQKYPVKSSTSGFKWMYRVSLGIDPTTGKRLQKVRKGFETKREAQEDCTRFLSQPDK